MMARGGHSRLAAGLAAGLAAALLTAGAAGCGNGGGAGSGDNGVTPPEASATSQWADDDAPQDPREAEREVRENWGKFFDPGLSGEEKAKVLENGQQLVLLLEAFNDDKRGERIRARVSEVRFTSPTAADVDYSLALEKATALPDASGTAVLQDGVWKVSVKTLCALVRLSDDVPKAPGCQPEEA